MAALEMQQRAASAAAAAAAPHAQPAPSPAVGARIACARLASAGREEAQGHAQVRAPQESALGEHRTLGLAAASGAREASQEARAQQVDGGRARDGRHRRRLDRRHRLAPALAVGHPAAALQAQPRLDSRASRLAGSSAAQAQHPLISNTASNSSSNSSRRARVKPMTSKTSSAHSGSKASRRSKSVGSMLHRNAVGVPSNLSSQYVVNLDLSVSNLRLECSLLSSLRESVGANRPADSRTPGSPFSLASSTSNASVQLASREPPPELRTVDLVVLKVSLYLLSFVLDPHELFSHLFLPGQERSNFPSSVTVSATTAYPPETPSSGASIPMSIYESEPPQRCTRFEFPERAGGIGRQASEAPQHESPLSFAPLVTKSTHSHAPLRSAEQRAAPVSGSGRHLLAPSAASHLPLALTESDESEGEKHVRKLSILATPMFHRRFARSNSAVINESRPSGGTNAEAARAAQPQHQHQHQHQQHPYAESKSFSPVPLAQFSSATLPLATASVAQRARSATRAGALGQSMSIEQQQQQQQQQNWEAPSSAGAPGVLCGAQVAIRQLQRQLHYPMPSHSQHRPLLERQRKLTCIGVPLYENLAMANAAQQQMPPFNQLRQHAPSQMPARALYSGGSASGSPMLMQQASIASSYDSPYRSHAAAAAHASQSQSQTMVDENDARAESLDRSRHDQQSSQNKVERYIQASNQQFESNTPTALRRARTRRLNTIAIPWHSGFSEAIIACSASGDAAGSVPRSAQSSRDALQHTLADSAGPCASGCASTGSSVSGLTGASPSQGTSPAPTPTGVKASILNRHLVLASGSTPRRQRKYSVVRFDPLPIAESGPLDMQQRSRGVGERACQWQLRVRSSSGEGSGSSQSSAFHREHVRRRVCRPRGAASAAGFLARGQSRLGHRHLLGHLPAAHWPPGSSAADIRAARADSAGAGHAGLESEAPASRHSGPLRRGLVGLGPVASVAARRVRPAVNARVQSVAALGGRLALAPRGLRVAQPDARTQHECERAPAPPDQFARALHSRGDGACGQRLQQLLAGVRLGQQPTLELLWRRIPRAALEQQHCHETDRANIPLRLLARQPAAAQPLRTLSNNSYSAASSGPRARIASNTSGQTGGCSSNQMSPSSEACSSPAFRDAPNWNFNAPPTSSTGFSWAHQQQVPGAAPLEVRSAGVAPPATHYSSHLQQNQNAPIRPNLLHFAPPTAHQTSWRAL